MRWPSEGRVAIGGLIAFAFWIFVALPLYYGPHDDGTPYKCPAKEDEQHGFWEKTRCDPVAYFTAWLVGFTGVLAVSTIGLWIVTWRSGVRQSRDMENAIAAAQASNEISHKTMVADQRAWLIVRLSVTSDFVVGRGTCDVRVSARIANIGKTPAFNVHTHIKEFAPGTHDIPTTLKLLCEEKRTFQPSWSRLVLPGEYYDRPWALSFPDDPKLRGHILPTIVGCVTYQILPDKSFHQTGFVYDLAKRGRMGQGEDLLSTKITTPQEEILCDVASGGIAD